MAVFAAAFQSVQRFFKPSAHPARLKEERRVRLFAALGSGTVASLVLMMAYYATLGFLPPATAYTTTEYPISAWAHRLDLAQFLGTLLYPPLPSPLTWWLGLAALLGAFVSLAVVYAVLLAWSLRESDGLTGAGFGAVLFLGLAGTISVANGLHPAILRNALPDTGLFLMGWSSLAMVQLLVVHLLYGGLLGVLYQGFSSRK